VTEGQRFGPEQTFHEAADDYRFAAMRGVSPASQRDADVNIGDYFSALLSFEGEIDRKRYGSLLAPVAFFFGGLNFLGFLAGILATWEIGGWVVLAALTGGMLATIPLSTRRARDIGWMPIFAPFLSVAALISIAAFMSLLLPMSLGIWRALEQTGFGLIWWALIFAVCIGIWAWWWNSLLDRPTKGEPVEETTPPAPDEMPRRAPLWFFVIWTAFWGVALFWSLVLAARYYITGVGDPPPLLAMLFVGVMVALMVWYWLRSGRPQPPKS
jgi:hypothetical protein